MMDVRTLGQAFIDWAGEEKSEYAVEYGSDNVPWSEVEEIFYSYSAHSIPVKELDGSKVKLLTQVGGEGTGEEYYLVFEVTNSDSSVQYFRVDGWYSSYAGVSWESSALREVKAVTRPVVFFE